MYRDVDAEQLAVWREMKKRQIQLIDYVYNFGIFVCSLYINFICIINTCPWDQSEQNKRLKKIRRYMIVARKFILTILC